jgi:hypothetical protein
MQRLFLFILLALLAVTRVSAGYVEEQQKDAQDRAAYWAARGYHFDPNILTAYLMDQKVLDINRAAYWAARGYHFDPDILTAYLMDQKVLDINRAKYWAARGYHFDPDILTAYLMDLEAAQTTPTKPPPGPVSEKPSAQSTGQPYPAPHTTQAISARMPVDTTTPAVIDLTPSQPVSPPAMPAVQAEGNRTVVIVQGGIAPTATLLQPISEPPTQRKAHASVTRVGSVQGG